MPFKYIIISMITCFLLLGCDNKKEEKEVEINILETQLNAIENAKNVEKIILEAHQKDVKTIESME